MKYDIQLYDTTGSLSRTEKDIVRKTMEIAVADWQKHIVSPHALTVALTIRDDLRSVAAQTNVEYTVPLATVKGNTLYTSVAAYKAAFGLDYNGSDHDIKIDVSYETITDSLYHYGWEYLHSIIIHEMGHGLFLYSLDEFYLNSISPIDRNITADDYGIELGGRSTLKIAGEPLPLLTYAHLTVEAANAFGSSFGPHATPGANEKVTSLDVAIASDCGLPTKFDDTIFAARYPGRLDAGPGNDIVVFDDSVESFDIRRTDEGWTATNLDKDYEVRLLNVEILLFRDKVVYWDN
jgi:hypothetical protein